MRLKNALIVMAFAAAVITDSCRLHAAGNTDSLYGEPVRMECTAYCEDGVTASGQEVRAGICAGKREWLGLTCIMYEDDNGKPGACIGIYEMLDTGSEQRIKEGKCIDIYMPGREECLEWGRRTVWVQLVEAEG